MRKPRVILKTAAQLRVNEEVKPCPFCGDGDDIQLLDDGIHWPQIMCTNCGAEMAGESPEDALVNWNERANG